MAFMGPVDHTPGERAYGHSAASYVKIFNHLKVDKVVRLNDPKYDKNAFTKNKIDHEDLIFMDGSVPPEDIVEKFVRGCEQHFAKPDSGAIAVHCKAGLGRTGTLIGIYCMKHYQIPAETFIGWIRIARPGSVLGPQQLYLCQVENNYIANSPQKLQMKRGVKSYEMSPEDKIKSIKGEFG
jgi:cell division cycle 14